MQISQEVTLVRMAKTGDEVAFADLLQLHAVPAFGTAVAILHSREDAEEVVQDAALTAFRSLARLRKEEVFGAWFTRIVVNKAIDRLRRRRRELGRTVLDEEHLAHSPEIDTGEHMDLLNALARLSFQQQVIIRLHYVEGYTTIQIAQLLRKPDGTIRRQLSESYRALRLILRGDP